MALRSLLYLPYYLKTTSFETLLAQVQWLSDRQDRTRLQILWDMMGCMAKCKASLHDYFDLRLCFLPDSQRSQYLCTGSAYEMHHRYNARSSVAIFRYKPRFLEVFADYIGREYLCVDRAPASEFAFWVDRWPRFIAKPADGVLGRGVTEIVAADWQSRDDLRMYLKRHRLGLLEEPIRQHDALSALCPSSVNTVRITTLCLDGSVEILSAVLRIGSGAFVDNLGAGGIAAPVDETCGTVIGPAVAKDVREDRHVRHPLTGAAILGFSIPFWPQVLRLVTDAARIVPDVHTVGWDVAVGANGPLLVEGNDNWDKTLAQLPSGKGLMPILCKLEQRVNSSSANR